MTPLLFCSPRIFQLNHIYLQLYCAVLCVLCVDWWVVQVVTAANLISRYMGNTGPNVVDAMRRWGEKDR